MILIIKGSIAILLVICGIYLFIPWAMKILYRQKFLQIVKRSGCICFTFDDGPDPLSTPKILKVLEEYDIKATFFVTGENVEKYPGIVSNIIALGHEIGNHSFDHSHPWRTGPLRTVKDLMKAQRIVKRYNLSNDKISFRPPYGKLNFVTLLYIIFTRYRVSFWSIDPKDYQKESADQIAKFVIDRLSPGNVILFHESRRRFKTDPTVTVSALKQILEQALYLGFKYSTVRDAYRKGIETDIKETNQMLI